MFGLTRRNAFDDIFDFHREVARAFDRFWNDLPSRTAAALPGSFEVTTTDDSWRIDVPLPGIDPQHVSLDVAGNTLSIRVEEPGDTKGSRVTRYEQTLTIPQFLDADRISASYRYGMLQLTLPLKESVKPRRIQIEHVGDERKQLAAA